ncbi:MAG: hypothetical protein NQU42_04650 [Methanothrix sp.]|uniref:hypothetical protein n=1 Tax=Methanothrix sp. TaxID=90426 RepID=UPI0025CDDF81|nr:hypothetical protein [Methanothrix sp.]MCQ8903364.1 hypothetical protein [Methanothrix sp.]
MTISTKGLFEQIELWVLAFVLAVALFNWPILSIPSPTEKIFGFPERLIYIFVAWILVILCAYIFDRRGAR